MNKIGSILIIDDSPFDRLIGERVISISGIADSCTVVDSVAAALDFLKQQSECIGDLPDAIFLDICMPGVDGFGFLDAIGKMPAIKNNCAIYMLSSSADPGDIRRALKSGLVRGFLVKPLTVEKAFEFLKDYQADNRIIGKY